jgi:signal transduction histidine kinase/CheY-like chemotaxis protein
MNKMKKTVLSPDENTGEIIHLSMLDSVLDSILDLVVHHSHSSSICLALYDQSSANFYQAYTKGLSDHFVEKMVFRFAGLADTVLQKNAYILCNNAENPNTCQLSQLARDEGIQSFISLPINNESQKLGVLTVYQTERDDYDDDELKFLLTFSRLISVFIGAELQVQQFQQAKLKAESDLNVKSNFLSTMSHEIRTPMNGIVGMLSLLKQSGLSKEQEDFVHVAHSCSESLLTLLNDILDISKIEAGKLQLEEMDFYVRGVVEGVIEMMAPRAYEKDIELSCLISSSVPGWVSGDPTRLRQIIVNLVSNAIKFTSVGEVVVRVTTPTDKGDKVILTFAVTDTGIGISKEAKSAIFQEFEQAESSTTREYGGTGLGLAISKQLTEHMGGEIWVESELGQGSSFIFTVLFKKAHSSVNESIETTSFDQNHALIVDNNRTSFHVLDQIFLDWSLSHDWVENGQQALSEMQVPNKNYDLILIENNLPDMTGLELAKQIKYQNLDNSIKVVLLTNFGQRGEGDLAKNAGVSAYITKPIRYGQLRDCLAMVLQGREDQLITKHSVRETEATKKAHLLLAEDDVFNQKVAITMLKRLGFNADIAENGLEILYAITDNHYDAILMDCQMPGMDGFETTARIREQELSTGGHIPIIAMTAHALPGDQKRCIDVGMDGYLTKPVSIEILNETLAAFIPEALLQPVDQRDLEKQPDIVLSTLEKLYKTVGLAFDRVVSIYLDDQDDAISAIERRVILKQARLLSAMKPIDWDEREKEFIHIPENLAKIESGIRYWMVHQSDFLNELIGLDHQPDNVQNSYAEPVDFEVLQKLYSNLGKSFHSAVKVYMRDAPRRINEMKQGVQSKDYLLAERAAHSLKSGSRYVGANCLAEQCFIVEKNVQIGDLDKIDDHIEEISSLVEKVNEVLHGFLMKNS